MRDSFGQDCRIQPARFVPGQPSAEHGTMPMQRPADPLRPPRRRDNVWTILTDAGVWLGLSVDAVIDRIETDLRTGR